MIAMMTVLEGWQANDPDSGKGRSPCVGAADRF
jgi:hypothetical protein